jgi:hypothetical protein
VKELYERIRNLAKEVGETNGEINKDNMAIIIGIADCNLEQATLCVSGNVEGVLEMISKTVYEIYGDDDDDTERIDGNFS